MLLRFAATNHSSIADRQEISLIATALKDADESVIHNDGLKGHGVLFAALLYGANASGKSNMLDVLMFIRNVALYSHERGGPETPIDVRGFRLREGWQKFPSEYDVDFILDGTRYHFGFSATRDEVKSEWLYVFPNSRKVMLYEREGPQDIKFGRTLKGRNRVIADLMRPNSLFFSAALQNDHQEIQKISKFFHSILGNNVLDADSRSVTALFPKDEKRRKRIVEFLEIIGTGICDLQVKEEEKSKKHQEQESKLLKAISEISGIKLDEKQETVAYSIKFKHHGVNGDYYLPLDRESAGTRRMVSIMDDVFDVFDSGGLMIIDEIDASLHTRACEAVISLFADRNINNKGAQLIATTHDTNLMTSKIFRRDQIWFAEKSRAGKTVVFSLADIRIRRADNIEKGYLEGRFGAIPFSGSVEDLFRD